MHTYGPDLVKQIREAAWANEFEQTPDNPIAPVECYWEHVDYEGLDLNIMLTVDKFGPYKALHASIGRFDKTHAPEDVTTKIALDLIGPGLVEIPQESFPPELRQTRQFFKPLPPGAQP